MRAHASAFLSDPECETRPCGGQRRPSQPRDHCWFAGDFLEARDRLERALALFEPGRTTIWSAERFGEDPGAVAMANLAVPSWPLGEVDRANALIDREHAGRGPDPCRTLAAAYCTSMSRIPAWRPLPRRPDYGNLVRSLRANKRWARGHVSAGCGCVSTVAPSPAASGASGSGLEDMRRGVEQLREQNVLFFDGLLKIALAEAEARAGDPDRALAILDEALATCDRLGYRAFEAELHRARGETLLKGDAANPAPAEEALLTAIAAAKQQGTRSFELRAALSLAKLYQSTGRPAEAHAVLAPALDGFAPTPEMPEIAEAQALLTTLAATDEVKVEQPRIGSG